MRLARPLHLVGRRSMVEMVRELLGKGAERTQRTRGGPHGASGGTGISDRRAAARALLGRGCGECGHRAAAASRGAQIKAWVGRNGEKLPGKGARAAAAPRAAKGMVEMLRAGGQGCGGGRGRDGEEPHSCCDACWRSGERLTAQLLEVGAGDRAPGGPATSYGFVERGMEEMEAAARALLEAGAGVNAGTGRRPLHAAAEKGMVEMVRELVGKGAEVDAEDGEGRTALTVALAGGKEAAARALLEAGAGVNAGTGRRPLHAAAEKGLVEMVRELAGKGAEVDAKDGEGRTALTVALAGGMEAAARALLEAGAGVNAGTGRRPLHAAAEKGMVEMVRELVGKDAEVDAEDEEGRTALTVALVGGMEAAARALLEAGAGVNAGTGRRPLHAAAEKGTAEMLADVRRKMKRVGRFCMWSSQYQIVELVGSVRAMTLQEGECFSAEILQLLARTGVWPLHGAAERGMVRFLRRLVEKGAELDAEDGEGRTALTVALAFGQEAAARALLEAGAGVNAGTGAAAAHAAGEKGMVEVLRELVEKGAEVDEEDGKGLRPLHTAVEKGMVEVLRELVEKGAEVDEEDARALLEAGAGVNAGTGRRPLHTAVEKEMVEVLSVLLGKGAEVDEEDGEGRTALTLALAGGKEAAARALLEAGAGVNAGTGRRPLHVAAEKGMVELVRELAAKGAEVDAEDA
ncbi:hypothetical protein CYMTET_56014 [Cymbomonas tetramitiformis]|uniref:Uncharacterized protein n=1 Tax=Cymbomonas tetramitiformis TaxID=36881 RepID=A0AAE0EP67_9CHLO|nr:hypothetical protein CYMTET_56014 [Cymbomonas tetramitiformis]